MLNGINLQYSFMQQLPCGFGEEPFIFPIDTEILSLKEQEKCEPVDCGCEVQVEKCCKTEVKQQKEVQAKIEIAKPLPQVKLCFKCKTSPGSILYKGQSMCKACSLRNVQYKCRVNLQNKIKITENDKVVLCLSGGLNSICLGNILFQLQKKFQKHLLFKSLQVVHVDLSFLNENVKQYQQKMKKIELFCSERGLKLNILSLKQLVGEQQVKQLLKSFGSGANQSDIVDLFISKLITDQYPEHLIALGTSGQRTASNILKFIVKGQGGSLEQLAWKHQNKILPLRQHLTKELQFYFYMNGLDQYLLEPPSLFSEQFKQINSINNILEDFIDNLQTSYSHTCPTILRTSQKIKHSQKGVKCSFCQSFTNQQENKLCIRCLRLKQFAKGDLTHLLPKDFAL